MKIYNHGGGIRKRGRFWCLELAPVHTSGDSPQPIIRAVFAEFFRTTHLPTKGVVVPYRLQVDCRRRAHYLLWPRAAYDGGDAVLFGCFQPLHPNVHVRIHKDITTASLEKVVWGCGEDGSGVAFVARLQPDQIVASVNHFGRYQVVWIEHDKVRHALMERSEIDALKERLRLEYGPQELLKAS